MLRVELTIPLTYLPQLNEDYNPKTVEAPVMNLGGATA